MPCSISLVPGVSVCVCAEAWGKRVGMTLCRPGQAARCADGTAEEAAAAALGMANPHGGTHPEDGDLSPAR